MRHTYALIITGAMIFANNLGGCNGGDISPAIDTGVGGAITVVFVDAGTDTTSTDATTGDAQADASVTCTTAYDCDLPVIAVCTANLCDPAGTTDPRSAVLGCTVGPTPGYPCKGAVGDSSVSCDGTCGGADGSGLTCILPCEDGGAQ